MPLIGGTLGALSVAKRRGSATGDTRGQMTRWTHAPLPREASLPAAAAWPHLQVNRYSYRGENCWEMRRAGRTESCEQRRVRAGGGEWRGGLGQ